MKTTLTILTVLIAACGAAVERHPFDAGPRDADAQDAPVCIPTPPSVRPVCSEPVPIPGCPGCAPNSRAQCPDGLVPSCPALPDESVGCDFLTQDSACGAAGRDGTYFAPAFCVSACAD